jgi:tetratricopeptide (TPR) repeat protein
MNDAFGALVWCAFRVKGAPFQGQELDKMTARVWDFRADDRPVEDLLRLAELLAGYRLDEQGGMVALDPVTWGQLWTTLRGRYPAQFTSTAEEILTWDRQEADACYAADLTLGVVIHLNPLVEAEPGNWKLRSERGQAHAALGHWLEALADFGKALEREADQQTAGWHTLCLAGGGDWTAHRRACTALLERFGNKGDAETRNDIAWDCVRFREGPGDTARPLKLAEQAVAARPRDANYLNTLGAALYRAARLEEAVAKLQEGIRLQETEGTASDWLFLALAHHRLGHAEEAKKWLAKAQRWLDQAPKDGPGALAWNHRLELRLLRAEAEEAISKDP